MLSPEQISKYRSGWQKIQKDKKQRAEDRYRQAMERTYRAAAHLKEKYKVKSVYLYGSLARGTHFDHRSDIDFMIEDFPAEASYWRMLVELEEITAPVEVNVVLSEDACPGLRDKARKEGKLL